MTSVGQSINHLYQSVDANFNYTGDTNVEKRVPLESTISTWLAPTSEGPSKLKLIFYTDDAGTTAELPEMDITMKRNEISAVAVDYKKTDGVCEVWMFIQEQWIMIHRLDIQ